MATTTAARTRDEVAALNILARKQRSLWMDAWARLLKNKAAVAGMVIIIAFYLVAIFAPLIAPHDPIRQYYEHTQQKVAWETGDWNFILGTDAIGRDNLSRIIYGARVSMTIGLVPITLYLLLGGTIGMIAGFTGGHVDNILMRIADVFYAFPGLLFMIIMVSTFRDTPLGDVLSGLGLLFLAIALVGWEGYARLVRGQVLQVKEKEFIEAARSIGANSTRLMVRHIFPNILAPIIVACAFSVPGAIMAEAGLSFIGIGIRPPTASWGAMIQSGLNSLYAQPALALAPAVCIALVMLSFTFLGDGLRDALDPRLKQ